MNKTNMRAMVRRPPITPLHFGILLVWLFWSNPAASGTHHDRQDDVEAAAAARAGEIRPLEEALARLRRDHPGRVLRVEVERAHQPEGHDWSYDFKLLTAEGHVLRIEMDAKTLDVFSVEGQR